VVVSSEDRVAEEMVGFVIANLGGWYYGVIWHGDVRSINDPINMGKRPNWDPFLRITFGII
jgi:MOSC domain-containing protein YiiM